MADAAARRITGLTEREVRRIRLTLILGTIAGVLAVAACGGALVPPEQARAPVVSVPVPQYVRPAPRAQAPRALQSQVDALVRAFPGRAGVAIREVDAGWTVESCGMLSLPQQSVSKLWVAMAVLDQRDKGRLKLDDAVTITRNDLTLFHQPIAGLVQKGAYTTTVGDLLMRALTQSDNTANDRLLWFIGGPRVVRAFIAEHRLGAIRFGPGERLLQAGTAGLSWDQSMAQGRGFEAARARLPREVREAAMDRYIADPPDGAAPLAIVDALARLARGELLSETSTRVLINTMAASRTGKYRLRAGLAPGWQVAHKTGTGQELFGRNAGLNDIGLVTAPNGRRYAVAVMIGETRASMRSRQQLIQSVAAALSGGRVAVSGGGDDES